MNKINNFTFINFEDHYSLNFISIVEERSL